MPALACGLVLAAVGSAGCRGGRVPPDELVVLTESPPENLDPRYSVTGYDFKVGRLVYAPLVSVDNQELLPQMELAESVTPTDPLHWSIALKEARFSDGRPVTAWDVAYTYETIRDPAVGSRLRQRFLDAGVQSIDVVDARHLVIALSHPHAPFVSNLDIGIIARPPDGGALAPGVLPVGAGPFALASRDGDTWRLVRNPHYFGGAPPLGALTFKTIRDDNSRLLALVGGSGDLTQNTISPLLLDAVMAQPRLRVETARSSVLTYLGLNCEDPILRDVRVRRAIAYAIDRRLIVHTKLHDRAVLATGMLPTFHWAYEPAVERYEHDPQRARALLDEAGYRDPDGDGPRPRFTLVYRTSNNRFRVAVAQVIVAMLAEVGIEADLRVNEFATFFADVKKGNFQMFTMQLPEISEPDLYTVFYAQNRIPTREQPDAGGNRVRYRNPALDALLDEARRELDRPRRIARYAEVQRILARDLPVIPLWHEDNVVAMGTGVSGYQMLPTAMMSRLSRTAKRAETR